MRILFCLNWPVDQQITSLQAADRFSPEYRIAGEPFWFFKHLDASYEVDLLDCRAPFGTHAVELKYTRMLSSQGVTAFVRSRRYDLVVSHGAQSALSFALLQTLLRRKRTPHVLFDVGRITGDSCNPRRIAACRYALGSLSAIITHSTAQLFFYREHFPRLAANAHFIPLGVDLDEFTPRTVEVEDQILCIGYAKRDWPTLVNAYTSINTRTKLVFLGIPPENAIAGERIVCLPKSNIEEMRALIARSRLIVLPLPAINYCIGQQTLLQSMAMGKTVLATGIPAMLDYVHHGQDGFLYAPENAADLAEKLRLLLSNPDLVARTGEAARRRVERDFSESVMAETLGKLFRQVAGADRFTP